MYDLYENLENLTKKFVMKEYEDAEKYAKTADDVYKIRAIAFGALQFSTNNLFPLYNNNLAAWWDEWLDKFNKLALDKQK